MKDMPKVAIIGSRRYENKRKIKEFIFKLKQQFGEELTIVSGGCQQGADKYAKKFAIEMGVRYLEFNPAHTVHNLYSGMPRNYYSKQYHPSQFFHRNDLLAKASDYCAAFIPPDAEKSNGTEYTIKRFKRLDKNVVIID